MTSLSFSVVLSGIRAKFSNVDQMSTDEFAAIIEDGKKLLLLDNRPTKEFIISHIENAIQLEKETGGIEEAMEHIQNQKPDLVVCYCSVGYRSSDFASELKKSDAVQCPVYNLEGSLFKWANEERPMVDNDGHTTKYAHPYNSFWGKLLRSDFRRSKI